MNLEAAGMDVEKQVKKEDSDSPLSEMEDLEELVEQKNGKAKGKGKDKSKGKGKGMTDAAVKKGDKEQSKKPAAAAKDKKEVTKEPRFLDPEAEGDEEADEEEIQAALSRPPPVHSDYLPLPWKGRLGYVSFTQAFDSSSSPLTLLGLLMYISSLLKPSRIQLSNLSHCINIREPPSASRP